MDERSIVSYLGRDTRDIFSHVHHAHVLWPKSHLYCHHKHPMQGKPSPGIQQGCCVSVGFLDVVCEIMDGYHIVFM